MSNDYDAEIAHPIDLHVGMRIRMRRREVGLTQGGLAEAIGVTFQQVQKYERAANRVSASKLWEVAHALQTTVGYFYEGLEDLPQPDVDGASADALRAFLLTPEGLELARSLPQIRDGQVRRKVVELVRALAEAPEQAAQAA